MIWQKIPGWEGIYEASETGMIRSVPRWIFQGNQWGQQMRCWRKLVVLRQSPNSRGYLTVGLSRNGRTNSGQAVHRLIALTFLGPCPEGLQVCHNNGDQTDNRIENLRYDTPSENIRDALRHGTFRSGTKHHKYRMDIDEAAVLRLRDEGWTYEQLAGEFRVGEATIGRILKGSRLKSAKNNPGTPLGRGGPGRGSLVSFCVQAQCHSNANGGQDGTSS